VKAINIQAEASRDSDLPFLFYLIPFFQFKQFSTMLESLSERMRKCVIIDTLNV